MLRGGHMLLGYYLTVKNRALNWVKLGLSVERAEVARLAQRD